MISSRSVFHKQLCISDCYQCICKLTILQNVSYYTLLEDVAAKPSHSITCPKQDCFTHTSGLAHAHSSNYTPALARLFIFYTIYRSCHYYKHAMSSNEKLHVVVAVCDEISCPKDVGKSRREPKTATHRTRDAIFKML